jgi:hypothetical protein
MTQDAVMAITSLLFQAGKAHHDYEQNVLKGVYDRDWPIWYAEYAIKRGLGNLLNRPLTPQKLSQFLSRSNKQYQAENPQQTWAEYTAQKMVQSPIE